MIISRIAAKAEVEECVDLYLKRNDHEFLSASKKVAIENLDRIVRRNKYVRIIKSENRIIAWLYADISPVQHCDRRILQQNYFATNEEGVTAYRVIKLLHEDLYQFALEHEFHVVISPGSHLDPSNTFVRILEKLGWERRHYVALKKTPLYFEP